MNSHTFLANQTNTTDYPLQSSKSIYFLILFFCFLLGNSKINAQSKVASDSVSNQIKKRNDSLAAIRQYRNSKHFKDSVAKARIEKIEQIKQERKRILDSASASRKQILDSSIAARKASADLIKARLKKRSDSLTAIRKYKESKHYKDSVTKVRTAHLDSIRNQRKQYFDSLKSIRQKTLDSALKARKKISDSLRAQQKIKNDSLAAIRKYKESKRYRDSVQVTRQSRLDSIKAVRKIYTDNILSARKKTSDSLAKYRKERMDSLSKARKIRADSLQNARDLRADSLAKKKELREKKMKADLKKREEKMKMQIELKMKKKHEAWSNEKMLKKKWGFVRRNFQNMFTRYNYYYNAKRKMQEANLNMQKRKKDNYEQIIDLFPFDPNKDSTVFASDMDTIIRKASIGLQIHDPRTKWADDLYLLMGQAYYFRGDFERAEACFKYIVGMNKALKLKKKKSDKTADGQLIKKEKSKIAKLLQHQPAQNDAILWLTRTYADSHRESESEAILDLMDASEKLSDNMKAKIALERANLKTRKGDYGDASKELSAILHSKAITKYTRQRASFLNGQLYYQISQFDSSAKNFKKNIALHPAIEMDFYAHKYQAEAIAQGGGNQSKSISTLKHLLKDGKYSPYHEQVYYLLGKLSANENNLEEALKYYQKSLEQGKTTNKQKAISFASMGNIQYRIGRFNLAKKSFDSASYFAKNLKDIDELNLALKRGKSLDKIEAPYYSLRDNDSLLKLALMSEKEQKVIVKKQLKYLEKQKEDSIYRAQNASNSNSLANSTSSTNSNWYFGSTIAVQQGYNEFKRKWGNRPLADNWRRGSASSFGADLNNNTNDSAQTDENGDNQISEQSLLAAIPKGEAQLALTNKKIRRAYLDLSRAYINDLEEYVEGLAMLDSLNKKYPNHEYPDEELSIRYTAALRQGNLDLAEQLRQELLSKYPTSEFANTLQGGENNLDKNLNENSQETVAQFYESTYQLATERQYLSVIERVSVAKRIYGEPNYNRKFRILEAQSFVGLGNYKKADTLIAAYIKENPADSLRPWVDAINKMIAEQKAADTASNTTKNIDTNQIKSNTAVATDTVNNYTYNPKENHLCVFIFGKADANTAGFRSGIEDYSRMKFSGLELSAEQIMLNANQAMVICKNFGSAGQAKIFMNKAKSEPLLFRAFSPGSYQAFIISEKNLIKLKQDKKLDEYLSYYNKHYK